MQTTTTTTTRQQIHKCPRCGELKILHPVDDNEKIISRDCRRHRAKSYQIRIQSLLDTKEATLWKYDHDINDFVEQQ